MQDASATVKVRLVCVWVSMLFQIIWCILWAAVPPFKRMISFWGQVAAEHLFHCVYVFVGIVCACVPLKLAMFRDMVLISFSDLFLI